MNSRPDYVPGTPHNTDDVWDPLNKRWVPRPLALGSGLLASALTSRAKVVSKPTNGKLPDPYPPTTRPEVPAHFPTDIKGYRNLTDAEIQCINAIKELAEITGDKCAEIGFRDGVDPRWVAIATTQLQLGFMALIRAVAKPDTF